MKRFITRFVAVIILFIALLYAGDYLSLRFKFPGKRPQFGLVTVTEMYAIHEKNNKTEYQFPPPQDQPCVNSLFPHFGYTPCWYLRRHTHQTIDI